MLCMLKSIVDGARVIRGMCRLGRIHPLPIAVIVIVLFVVGSQHLGLHDQPLVTQRPRHAVDTRTRLHAQESQATAAKTRLSRRRPPAARHRPMRTWKRPQERRAPAPANKAILSRRRTAVLHTVNTRKQAQAQAQAQAHAQAQGRHKTASRAHLPRLLLPVLPYGPNNQFHTFRQALALAKWLNRTMVAPPFFQHETETDDASPIDPAEVFDLDRLNGLQPVVHWKSWRGMCADNVDIIFHFQGLQAFRIKKGSRLSFRKYIARTFKAMGIDPTQIDIPSALVPKDIARWSEMVQSPSDALRRFKSKKRCAVVVMVPLSAVVISYGSALGLTRHWSRSRRIQRLAKLFAEEIIGGDARYAVLHWRYNDEWSMLRCKQAINGSYDNSRVLVARFIEPCRSAIAVTRDPTQFFHNLKSYLTEQSIRVIYVATPVSQSAPFMVAFKKSIVGVLTLSHLLDVVGKDNSRLMENSGLQPIQHNFDASLVEQELASASTIFIASKISTWSTNVIFERRRPLHRTWPAIRPTISVSSIMERHETRPT